MIHLLSNGHTRCGTPAGHLSLEGWPDDTGITSNPAVATCPTCRERSSLPPVPAPPALARVVEVAKEAISNLSGEAKTGMDLVTLALMNGTTIGELRDILQKAIPPSRPPVGPGEA